jgi:hypothetical protein
MPDSSSNRDEREPREHRPIPFVLCAAIIQQEYQLTKTRVSREVRLIARRLVCAGQQANRGGFQQIVDCMLAGPEGSET